MEQSKESDNSTFRVCLYGEPVLRQEGSLVTEFDDKLKAFVKKLFRTMYEHEGIGLAAQQVGEAIQVCVIDMFEGTQSGAGEYNFTYDGKQVPLSLIMPLTIINPEVEVLSEDVSDFGEGCLSFPGIFIPKVIRPNYIKVKFQDVEGGRHEIVCDGLFARVILHEVDHLFGKLFIDRIDRKMILRLEPKLKRLRRISRDYIKENK